MPANSRDSTESAAKEPFEDVLASLRAGNEEVQSSVFERILPDMVAALQRRFGSTRSVDVDGAVASACRTVLRRGWQFRRSGPQGGESLEPRDWGELAGLLVRFAYNKARTQRNKRVDPPLPAGEDDQDSSAWHPVDDGADALSQLIQEEMREQVRWAQEALLGSLTEIDRHILRGKLDGLTLASIKEELRRHDIHRTEDAIRKRWSRTIVPLLQRLLSDCREAV